MQKRKAKGFIFLLVVLFVGIGIVEGVWNAQPKGNGTVHVKTIGTVDDNMQQEVQKTAESFNDIVLDAMQVRLKHDVTLYVTSTREDYQDVLQRHFHMKLEEAARVAKISGGWTSGKTRITALNGAAGVMDGANDRISTTGHELFHQLQYELSSGKDTDENALFWLEEGSADYIGAVVAEKRGKQKMEKWQRDRIYEIRSLQGYAKPEELLHCTLEQRKKIMEADKHAYLISDLMVIYLMQQQPEQERCLKLAQYFQALTKSSNGEQAFLKTFGVTQEDFLENFAKWFQQMKQAPPNLQYAVHDGVDAARSKSLQDDLARTQAFLRQNWGAELHGTYKIVLTANKDDFAKAMIGELAVTSEEAGSTAQKNLWVGNGSTVLVNMEQMGDRHQQIFNVAAMTARLLQSQTAMNHTKQLEWLSRGSVYLVATHMMGESGFGTLNQYKKSWLHTLHEKAQWPNLAALKTSKDWTAAQDTYGQEIISAESELAAEYLLNRYGWKSFYDWYVAASETKDADKAFETVYGKTSKDFAVAFEYYLMEQL